MPKSNTEELPQIRAVDDWVPWLAGLLQLIAAVGWLCAWIVVASVNAGLVNAFPEGEAQESWQYSFWFGFFNIDSVAVIFGWPFCFVVAWIRYFRNTKANRRQLLLCTCLPYVHLLLLVISLALLAGLDQFLKSGM
jgi:hypothetical protein